MLALISLIISNKFHRFVQVTPDQKTLCGTIGVFYDLNGPTRLFNQLINNNTCTLFIATWSLQIYGIKSN